MGLAGHSDADVLTHAIMDALLGAAGLGDIGRHFPDTNPAYKGISSLCLLKEVGKLLARENWQVANIDATIICQAPKLAPYRDNMQQNMAKTLQLPPQAINIKFTTEEGLGFTGAGQGIAAQAVCLISILSQAKGVASNMKIQNTLTGKKEVLTPITPGQIKMYTCGQTVYNDIHIGNARFYVAFDAIRRYLEYKGYEVKYVQNFTDIEDKIIQRATEEGCATHDLADKYIARTMEDLDSLNVMHATIHPKATNEIPEIITMIQRLIQGGHAYHINGSVYFNTVDAEGYGKLSRKNIEDLLSGARVEVDAEKQNPTDFILWKPAKEGEPYWESPWGRGRPGWHIECSAMALKYLGEEIDIHGGASDLIFPHHENEIAQSEAANGKNFARYWMHCGILTVNHKKMGKSQGNFQTLREVAQRFPYDVIRFYLVSGHYRAPMEFTDEVIKAAEQGLNRIKNCHRNLAHAEKTVKSAYDNATRYINPGGGGVSYDIDTLYRKDYETKLNVTIQKDAKQYVKAFETAMEDDFNAADAVTAIYELVTFANKQIPTITKDGAQHLREKLELLCGLLGIELEKSSHSVSDNSQGETTGHSQPATTLSDDEIEAQITARAAARAAKNFAESDRIRDELAAKGVIIEDTRGGQRWHRA